MSLEADLLIDRRRLKRGLIIWRVVAVLAILAALLISLPHRGAIGGAYVARFRIDGLIDDGTRQIEKLDRLRRDPDVSAVLLHLDTPGGAVSGGEGLHDAVLALAAVKPVVAVMDGTAASAGYMIAVAAPHIVARASTLTGSIGVLMQTGDISGLLDKLGIRTEELVSGPLKGQPSFTAPLSPAGHDYLQALLMDLYDQFVGIVATGRHMDPAKVRQLADGRAYTGRQALALGLVDELGGEPEARRWLETTRHVAAGLPVRDADRPGWVRRHLQASLGDLFVTLGQGLRVDGAWALWQPQHFGD